eukprot:6802193-Alexandrium_andersonii.AAC.1
MYIPPSPRPHAIASASSYIQSSVDPQSSLSASFIIEEGGDTGTGGGDQVVEEAHQQSADMSSGTHSARER